MGLKRSSRYDVYVDGSFINGATGYGAVILENRKVVDELSGAVHASEVNGTRQVAGELVAVKEALNWCLEHSVSAVSIYYDYLGIEKWARGEWKTNQPLTKEYARFVRECPIKIRWHKVDSHTGDRWNDRADALAKTGAASSRFAGGESAGGQSAGGDSAVGQSFVDGSAGGESAGESASGRGGGRSAGSESELVSELIKKTEAWIEFLMLRGVEARFDRVLNQQFARVYIRQQDATVGTFDLYNTRKKRFSPYVHNFRDKALKVRIESLWMAFLGSQRAS